jgi:phage N-6-adenine-methyltransferase
VGHDCWSTPREFFVIWDRKFHFDLDACATKRNAKCPKFFTKRDDALKQTWTGTVWMNPPYSRKIHQWVRKAWESAQAGATVVCLVPASTDTSWFHTWCTRGHVVFVRGRLSFKGAGSRAGKGRASSPSIVVIFHSPRRPCPLCRGLGRKDFSSTIRTLHRGG